jgi:hypothetical protein
VTLQARQREARIGDGSLGKMCQEGVGSVTFRRAFPGRFVTEWTGDTCAFVADSCEPREAPFVRGFTAGEGRNRPRNGLPFLVAESAVAPSQRVVRQRPGPVDRRPEQAFGPGGTRSERPRSRPTSRC